MNAPGTPDEPPPFATWPVLYAVVIAGLLIVIALLAWLTAAGS